MYEDEIEQGVALLDDRLGRDVWLKRMNLDELDMGSYLDCTIAQVTGKPYSDGLRDVGLYEFDGGAPTIAHGFEIVETIGHPADERNARYRELTEAWRGAITALRAAREDA